MPDNEKDIYKWIVGFLFAIIMFLTGGAYSEYKADKNIEKINQAITDHKNITGHPVMVERVAEIKTELKEINQKLDRLLAK